MNKQQLASKIWQTANSMRSKIEANEYKDYILGFIFYKFLSDKEEAGLKADGWTDDDLKESLVEEDKEMVSFCQNRYGYFISYENLFSTWLKMGKDFDVSNVRDALSAFTRLINVNHKKVFENIFGTLETGLSKLGDNSGAQTKAISDLIALIDPIPMDDKQGYDVLGFIYEYLISMFAANAGKKAGEFYTPHEVSMVMSQIVANHLQHKDKIEIYDPTSGSGSLLITIGQSVAKYLDDSNKIKYYAQELKEATYSLTRMNLIMRGIKPENIVTRCGDTLAEDWPYFDDNDKENTYETLFVDAVVSNPPYSQPWTPKEDPRFTNYGIAPKSKADYAFLLHDLYHLNRDGIMTIVLPHGVLFRGGEEETIRKNLIENDHIDTIIGLPANIFFGTGIPTIIMVLKKQRTNNDVLIVDASKGFIKVGKNNKLQASDIKKIVDTVVNRIDVPKYSRVVSKDEIRANDYNLNIPRYVDSSEKADSYDIYASMFGGIPNSEINELHEYWTAFPTLKEELFSSISSNYSELKNTNVKDVINNNKDVVKFLELYKSSFDGFDIYLYEELIKKIDQLNIVREETIISDDIFNRLSNIPLINKYDAYQLFNNEWVNTSIDLEVLKTEGFNSVKKVNPKMVIKKKDGKEKEVQEGWEGHILPFELIKETLCNEEANNLASKENRLLEISSEITEILENLSEDEKEEVNYLINDEGDAFVNAEVTKYVKKLKGKSFEKDSIEYKIKSVQTLIDEEKELKKEIKVLSSNLEILIKNTIENLTDEQAVELLKHKWIKPIIESLSKLPTILMNNLTTKLNKISTKYETTYLNIDEEIEQTENELADMIDELDANEFDLKGLQELQKLLRGE